MDDQDRTFSPVSQEFSTSKRLESSINPIAQEDDDLPTAKGVQDSALDQGHASVSGHEQLPLTGYGRAPESADGNLASTDTTGLQSQTPHAMTSGMGLYEAVPTQSFPVQPMTAVTPSQRLDPSGLSEVQWPSSVSGIESQHPATRRSIYPSLNATLPKAAISGALSTANTPSILLTPTTDSQANSTSPRLPQLSTLITAPKPNATESSLLLQPQNATNNSSSRVVYLNLATSRVNAAGRVDLVKRNLLHGTRRGFAVNVGKIKSIPALNSFLTTYFNVTFEHYGLSLYHLSGYASSFYSHTKDSYCYHLGPASTQESWTTVFNHLIGRCMPRNHCAAEKCSYCRNPPFVFACIDEIALSNALLSKGVSSSTSLRLLDEVQLPKPTVPVISGFVGQADSDHAAEARKLPPMGAQYTATVPTNPQATAIAASRKRSASLDDNDAPASKKLRSDSGSVAETQDDKDKERDWTKATPKPTGTTKALTDTCLTCVQYKRFCKGTTLDQNGKCQNCQGHREGKKSKRKCFWQNRPAGIITYQQARKDNGKCWDLPQNTREAVAKRARSQTPSTIAQQSFTSDLVQDTLASLPNYFPAIDSQAFATPLQHHTPTDSTYTNEGIDTATADTRSLTYDSIMGHNEEPLGSIDQEALGRALDEWSNNTA